MTLKTLRVFAAIVAFACIALARPAAAETINSNPVVRFTVFGAYSFDVELFANETPATVANFLGYMNAGSYTNTIVHRSTTNLVPAELYNHVVQGGGYTKLFSFAGPEITSIPTAPPISNAEARLPHLKGTIAMARGDDPVSATSQWFFNTKDNPGLDAGGYTVFGEIVAGIEVLNFLAGLPVLPGTLDNYTSPTTFIPTEFESLPIYFEGDTGYLVTITSIAPVPEPSTWALAGIGLAAAAWATRRRSRHRA